MTKQRLVIKQIIREADEHLTAEQIYVRAIEHMPSIAIATVYRNLTLMVRAGEIRRVSVLNAPDRFDRTVLPHNHLLCDRCGKLADIRLPDLQDFLQARIQEPILSYELTIRYVCGECVEGEQVGKN